MIDRAVRGLRELGCPMGEIVENGWEGRATIDMPNIGRFRLVGPWLPGWADELEGSAASVANSVPGSGGSRPRSRNDLFNRRARRRNG